MRDRLKRRGRPTPPPESLVSKPYLQFAAGARVFELGVGHPQHQVVAALGLALVFEGAAYALFPNAMRAMMLRVLEQGTANLRFVGLVAAVLGVGIVWLVRG